MMGAHRMFGKEVLFQEALRVPYVVRLPGQRKAITISQQISQIDFIPTVLELLGRPIHQQCAGTSRAAWLRGDTAVPGTIFVERSPVPRAKVRKHTRLANVAAVKRAIGESSRVAISVDGWKLCLRDSDKNELYNLKADPVERENLYGRRELRPVIARLTAEIHSWQEKNRDLVKLSVG